MSDSEQELCASGGTENTGNRGYSESHDSQEKITRQDRPSPEEVQATAIKTRRRQLRGKITRTINRLSALMDRAEITPRRITREITELQKDFVSISELHSELYDYVPQEEHSRMNKWEYDLNNDRYLFEENVEDYVNNYDKRATSDSGHDLSESDSSQRDRVQTRSASTSANRTINTINSSNVNGRHCNEQSNSGDSSSRRHSYMQSHVDIGRNSQGRQYDQVGLPFDAWIDDLVEFKETELPRSNEDISVADALHRLEASKDIPSVKLCVFDGNPLCYVEFIETFKIHVHDKKHLTDNMRMVQLKMHLSKESEKVISGLGCGGIMYATALKLIKEQFGQPSVIARACICKLTKGSKIVNGNREGLRDLLHDVVNCIATLQRLSNFADANATENLRQIVTRLPDHLISKWKSKVTEIREQGQAPTLEHIGTFLRKQVQSAFDPDFGDLDVSRKSEWKGNRDQRRGIHSTQKISTDQKRTPKCYVCEDNHRITDCPTYKDSSVPDRIEIIKKHHLCFACLVRGHLTRDCRSKRRCAQNGCNRTHHQTIHVDPPSASGALPVLDKQGMLPVVRALFRSTNGRVREGNVLIDSGAGATIIRKDFSEALGLQGKREGLQLSVVGGKQLNQRDSRRVKFWISSVRGGEEFEVHAHEIDKTVLSVPPLDRPWLSSFPHLSDIEIPHKAGPIDLVLGVQYSHLHAEEEIRQGLPFEPVGKRTKLGWFIIGADNTYTPAVYSVNFFDKVDMNLLYDLETLGIRATSCTCSVNNMSNDDKAAMEIFKSSCHKEADRYEIELPWKKDPCLLPDNYALAEKRLCSLERSLQKNPDKAFMYSKAIKEYEDNQWAVPLTDEEKSREGPVYYLPHHGVYRPDKRSTPLRVVFDPACRYNGVSLNSFLLKGPCLIGDLLGVLMRFREERIAFMGDISKMFLQILLTERDSHVHRFLWRDLDNSKDPIIYRLTRVTFGDKPSPDMASYVMLKLAEEFKDIYPEAAVVLRRDRYVDDLIHSCETLQEAKNLMKQLTEILESGSFKIKEWFYTLGEERTEKELIPSIDQGDLKRIPGIGLETTSDLKTLGVCWEPNSDTIHFKVKDLEDGVYTKRSVLSKLSMLYDPLGLVCVVTVKARIAMQDIWRLKDQGWDDPLPVVMQETWRKLFRDLKKLQMVQFPRCVKPPSVTGDPELHVFADASSKAYGAVAYILWPTDYGPSVKLFSGKVRVAPLKQTTIPRLELMAALIACRLAKTITTELKHKLEVVLWTDSQIVLHWINADSISLKPFVGVRVSEIQSSWKSSQWKFVPTEMNPADDLSRGIDVEKITGRWLNGPEFLSKGKDEWPKAPRASVLPDDNEYRKPKPMCSVRTVSLPIQCHNFSSWQRLVRVTAYCQRFLHNMKAKVSGNPEVNLRKGVLQPIELELAERHWIQQAQGDLPDWQERYKDLTPFVDNGIVRVGGRLGRSSLPYEQVHPILLTSSSQIAKLIMRAIHLKVGHAGCERTLCESRRQYWIVKGRNLAREIVRTCVICRKLRQPAHKTLMGDLPAERMKLFSPVFDTTGVDLFGPFNLKFGRNKTSKAWGAIFTCATVRAIHLEIVDGLSTQAFLQALRRFVAQHGWPTTIISDNGTSFVGAEGELRKLVQDGRKHFEEFAMLHKVKWIFITPLSPHQGGFYESLIKQAKRAIQVAIGQQTLTWNEMSTVFAEVKCLVNSRPLGYSSNDANDFQPLTPNHFLLGRASAGIPQGPFEQSKNLHKRFEFVQALVGQFWSRFVKEYVPTLMRRNKWALKGRQMKVGDIVLLTDSSSHRGNWSLARVEKVFAGHDGIVRNVEVKTKTGIYRRSIQRCCPILEMES